MSYTEDTEEEKKEFKRLTEMGKIAAKEKREYNKKWHPKKPRRKRGLKRGEWKGRT